VNVLLVLLVFAIVLTAELPDKTMFASLMLGTRFSARWVFLGAASAFLVHVVIAVSAGSLLTLLPQRALDIVVAALFLAGAAFMLHASRAEEQGAEEAAAARAGGSAWTGIISSFVVIFLGEWGDITQIATANLAARYNQPLAVGVGALLGLWTAALLAITAGRTLLRHMSAKLLHRVGAVVFVGFAVYSIVRAAQ
jgi:putative Ca2+/H+ antiporter (TMEM165/GDT1 family)